MPATLASTPPPRSAPSSCARTSRPSWRAIAVAAAVPTVVIVERVPGRAEAILAGIGDGAVTCVAEDADGGAAPRRRAAP